MQYRLSVCRYVHSVPHIFAYVLAEPAVEFVIPHPFAACATILGGRDVDADIDHLSCHIAAWTCFVPRNGGLSAILASGSGGRLVPASQPASQHAPTLSRAQLDARLRHSLETLQDVGWLAGSSFQGGRWLSVRRPSIGRVRSEISASGRVDKGRNRAFSGSEPHPSSQVRPPPRRSRRQCRQSVLGTAPPRDRRFLGG